MGFSKSDQISEENENTLKIGWKTTNTIFAEE